MKYSEYYYTMPICDMQHTAGRLLGAVIHRIHENFAHSFYRLGAETLSKIQYSSNFYADFAYNPNSSENSSKVIYQNQMNF